MSNLFIKLRKPDSGLRLLEFSTWQERSEWLRSNGFYESGGIHRHLDGRTAGVFSGDIDQIQIAKTCDKPVKRQSVWGFLCKT